MAAFIYDRVLSRQVSMSPMRSIEELLLGFGAHGQAVMSELAGKSKQETCVREAGEPK